MEYTNPSLQFFLELARVQAIMARRFDSRLGGGLGLSDFVILYHLSQAEDEKLRRVDLADKVGLTASGVTRMLAPMEKIGLVVREKDARDARVSYVMLGPGGRQLLNERLERAEFLAEEVMSPAMREQAGDLTEVLTRLSVNLSS